VQLQDLLFSQGFGTRRVCAGLVQQGFVTVEGQTCTDALAEFEPEGLAYAVQGVPWTYQAKAYVMLHKPAGTECSQKPSTYPSIYTLLPAPLRQRPNKGAVQGVQAVGRLDQDTTGLLLLRASDWPYLKAPYRLDYGPMLRTYESMFTPQERRQLMWLSPNQHFGF